MLATSCVGTKRAKSNTYQVVQFPGSTSLVVGDASTKGHGAVHSLVQIGGQLFAISDPPKLGVLKIAVQQFYRPSGDGIQQRGVIPDIILPSLIADVQTQREDVVPFDTVPAAKFTKLSRVNEDLVNKLKAKSDARRGKSGEHAKLLALVKRKAVRKQEAVSLNATKFAARQAEFDADQAAEKLLNSPTSKTSDGTMKLDLYLAEVLSIAADYAKAILSK